MRLIVLDFRFFGFDHNCQLLFDNIALIKHVSIDTI
jgi:hypothetical protein